MFFLRKTVILILFQVVIFVVSANAFSVTADFDFSVDKAPLLRKVNLEDVLIEYGSVSSAAEEVRDCAESKKECLLSFLGLVISFKLSLYYQDAINLIEESNLSDSTKNQLLPVLYTYLGTKSSLLKAEVLLSQGYEQGDYVAGVNLASLLFKKKEYRDSFLLINEVLEKDDNFFSKEISLVVLGQHYQFGLGVNKDLQEAKKIYSKKTGLKSAAVQYLLGKIELELGGYAEAIEILKYSAALGSSEAAQDLGVFYSEGKYVNQDEKSAMKYYFLSGRLGSSVAYYDLAILLNRSNEFKLSKISMVLAAVNGDLNARRLLSDRGVDFKKYTSLQSDLVSKLKSFM